MTINELYDELRKLNCSIKQIQKLSEHDKYEDLSGLDGLETLTADGRMLLDELYRVMNCLDEARRTLDYLNRPIKGEYVLRMNSRGRYECPEQEFTCGYKIEFLYYDKWDDCEKWAVSRVEAEKGNYYIVGHKDLSLEGLHVRIRGN